MCKGVSNEFLRVTRAAETQTAGVIDNGTDLRGTCKETILIFPGHEVKFQSGNGAVISFEVKCKLPTPLVGGVIRTVTLQVTLLTLKRTFCPEIIRM